MRDRILTPGFPLPGGAEASASGAESPARELPARELEGRAICNGRYLLRRKTGHSRTTVRFAAHDIVSDSAVAVDLHPDESERTGYRLGRTGVDDERALPDLRDLQFEEREGSDPGTTAASGNEDLLALAWRAVRAAFRRSR
jgi:hypothetical protein